MVTSKEKIENFLNTFNKIAQEHFYLINRDKNNNTLIELGYTNADIIEAVKNLSYLDYCNGPCQDYDKTQPGDIWTFGTNINDIDIYIKLKIKPLKNDTIAVCISFHKAEFPLYYPYGDLVKVGEKND